MTQGYCNSGNITILNISCVFGGPIPDRLIYVHMQASAGLPCILVGNDTEGVLTVRPF